MREGSTGNIEHILDSVTVVIFKLLFKLNPAMGHDVSIMFVFTPFSPATLDIFLETFLLASTESTWKKSGNGIALDASLHGIYLEKIREWNSSSRRSSLHGIDLEKIRELNGIALAGCVASTESTWKKSM